MAVITGQNFWKHAFRLCTIVGSLWAIATGAQAESPSQPLGSQVTAASDCGYFAPFLSGDGQWIAATTNCPESGSLPMRHVVRIHRASRRVEAVTPPGVFSDSPSISADGQRVVFLSDGDLIPGQNPDQVLQLFLYDDSDRRYTQLTHFRSATENQLFLKPQLSGNGDSVVLTSDADFVPGQNGDGNEEVFVFDLRSNGVVQITHTTPPARHLWSVISHDGQTVLFVENLQPQLPGGGTNLYAWTREKGEIRLQVDSHIRVMPGVFDSLVLAGQGHRAAFASRMDFLGENPDLNSEVYTVDIPSGTVRQATHSSACLNLLPTLSAEGRWLVFVSNCEFEALNEDGGGNLFAMRPDTGEVIQLTQTGGGIVGFEPLSVDLAGRTVAFAVGGNLPGRVMRSQQVFTANLPARKDEPLVPPRFVEADDITALVVSAHDPAVMYLTTRRWGILKSIDAGHSWKLSSYRMGSENVTCLVEDPARRNVLYAGTANTGLYRTADSGEHWFHIEGLSSRRILSLAIDPAIPGKLSVQTPEGLFWSADYGSRWEPANDQHVANSDTPQAISTSQADRLSDPSHPSVLVARSDTRGLMLSRDGGAHWESLRIQPPSRKGLESVLKRPERVIE
jgi:Tol biopolymer transport system component